MADHFLKPLLRSSSQPLQLYVHGGTRPVASSLETAFEARTRNRGLLGRDGLAHGHALIIAPCNMVHTIGMRFAIDLIYAAKDGRIVKLRPSVPSWRISGAVGAFTVIEMAAGGIADAGLRVGQVLEVR